MTKTQEILERDNWQCRYCKGRATERDHYIKANQARRRPAAQRERENPKYQAAACHDCNGLVGPRCFVPTDSAHLIPELERITGNVYGTFNGDPATLRGLLV